LLLLLLLLLSLSLLLLLLLVLVLVLLFVLNRRLWTMLVEACMFVGFIHIWSA